MTRLSGITASGHAQLGNYLGAIDRWAREPTPDDLYFIADLHAMTTAYNPSTLRALAREQFAVLLAAGVPEGQIFVQSDLIREHAALTWVLECVSTYSEAARMIQFKEKSEAQAAVKLSLLTYPALMAADILLHGAHEVPVGEDQAQHVELARTLARRFNGQYGEVFVIPKAVLPAAGARVRDLSDPSRKMGKSARESTGIVFLLDPPELIRRKIRRAVTDTSGEVHYAPTTRLGVANLLEILGACTGATASDAAAGITGYAQLKDVTADAVIETLRPVRERTEELLADPAELDHIKSGGARRAAEDAEPRLNAALRMAGAA